MSTSRFSASKKFLQLLIPQRFSIFTFGPSFKVKSNVEFIFSTRLGGGKLGNHRLDLGGAKSTKNFRLKIRQQDYV